MKFTITLITLLSFSLINTFADDDVPAPNGLSALPHAECIDYVAKHENTVFKINKANAFNHAVNACNHGMVSGCVKLAYDHYNSLSHTPSAATKYANWNKALRGCRERVHTNCLTVAWDVWQNHHNKTFALERAMKTCREAARGSCLEYAYEIEKKFRPTERRAFEGAEAICQTGVGQDCLKYMYENLIPEFRPDLRDAWGSAVNGCRRKNN